jgi:hypothetical protein
LTRFSIILLAGLIGAAAPVRAWCEATCLAPAHRADDSSKAHCPTHDPAASETSIASTTIDDCPVVESARPTAVARLDLKAAIVTIESPQFAATFVSASLAAVSSQATTVFQRHTPLRI